MRHCNLNLSDFTKGRWKVFDLPHFLKCECFLFCFCFVTRNVLIFFNYQSSANLQNPYIYILICFGSLTKPHQLKLSKFSSTVLQTVMKFWFLQKETSKGIPECMMQTLNKKILIITQLWGSNVLTSGMKIPNAFQSLSMSTPEIVDPIHR